MAKRYTRHRRQKRVRRGTMKGGMDDLDMGNDNSFQSQGSLRVSDLNTSRMSGYTTDPDHTSFGSDDTFLGGKKRKKRSSIKKRNGKKVRKTCKNRRHKQRGGICYGNGVGANSYDPNYSIYNTNMLKLFPYKA